MARGEIQGDIAEYGRFVGVFNFQVFGKSFYRGGGMVEMYINLFNPFIGFRLVFLPIFQLIGQEIVESQKVHMPPMGLLHFHHNHTSSDVLKDVVIKNFWNGGIVQSGGGATTSSSSSWVASPSSVSSHNGVVGVQHHETVVELALSIHS